MTAAPARRSVTARHLQEQAARTAAATAAAAAAAVRPVPVAAPAPPAPGPAGGRSQREDLRQLGRGSSLNLAGSAVAALLNLITPIVITRGFPRATAGSFFAATALFYICINIGTAGADTGLLRAIPRARTLGRTREVRSLLRIANGPPLVVSVVLGLVLAAFAPRIAELSVGKAAGQPANFRLFLYVLAAFLPVAVLYVNTVSSSRGFGAIKPLVLVEKVGRPTVQTGLVGLAAVISPSVGLLVVAWSLPYVAGLIVIGLVVRRLHAALLARPVDDEGAPRPVREVAREFWGFSGPRAVSRVFNVALQRFDILLVGALRGPADAAVYTAASRFLVLGTMFVLAIQQVMAPKISELLARDDRERSQVLYRTTTAWLTIVSWPVYLIAAVFAPLLLHIFGQGYERGAPAVVILCLAMLVSTTCGPVDTILLMGGRSSLSLFNTGAALAVDVGLDLVLVPRYGITGAAIGWMAAILVNNLVPLAQVHRTLQMHPFGRQSLSVMVIAGGCTGLLPLAVRLVLGPTLPALLLSLVLGGATFLFLLYRRREALSLDALTGVLRRRRGGGGRPVTA